MPPIFSQRMPRSAAPSNCKRSSGAVAKRDAAMLGGVLDLKDLKVLDIMVHRTKMQTINIDDAPEKVIDEVLEEPAYAHAAVEGRARKTSSACCTPRTCYGRCRASAGMSPKLDIGAVAAQPWFVPDTTSVGDQLNEFLQSQGAARARG